MGSLSPPTKFAVRTSIVTLDQNPPVFNTLHEVFHYIGGVKINHLLVIQTNTPTNNEEIDVLITIDGREILYDSSVVNVLNNNTTYAFTMTFQSAIYTTETALASMSVDMQPIYLITAPAPFRGFEMKGHDIMVQVRQTSAIAAGARIRVACLVERLVAV